MDTETFPDVTLANNSATENHALNAANQNEGNYKDTSVVLKSKRHRKQSQITHPLVIILIAIIVLIIAVVITFFVTKNQFCGTNGKYQQCSQSLEQLANWTTVPLQHASITPTTDNSTAYPWYGVRLPSSVKPSLYELHLKIDLTKFIYQGSVNITLQIIKPTKFIIFHRNEIDIEQSLVTISSPFSPNRVIVKQFHWPQNNFHVVEMDSELEAGNIYILSVGSYSGLLGNDLRGLYLSSYKTHDGEIRYLAVTQFQAMDARRAFPCFDEPNFKARFKISITYQPDTQRLSPRQKGSMTRNDLQEHVFSRKTADIVDHLHMSLEEAGRLAQDREAYMVAVRTTFCTGQVT